ncbi:MAG: hypothetical protein IJW70_06885 [Clostridia bacterium]|nr:hypothetical protein [Clostridia bacterium]
MNKEEKSKTSLSSGGIFVDVFIGFLIAACIAGIVYRCFIYDPHVSEEVGQSYMVYFEIEDAHQSYADYLNSGDTVYDATSGLRIGTIAVHKGSVDGQSVSVLTDEQNPESLTVMGVLRSRSGVMEQGSLVLDGTYTLTPGQVLEIYTDTVSVKVRILQISEQTDGIVLQEPQDSMQTDSAETE